MSNCRLALSFLEAKIRFFLGGQAKTEEGREEEGTSGRGWLGVGWPGAQVRPSASNPPLMGGWPPEGPPRLPWSLKGKVLSYFLFQTPARGLGSSLSSPGNLILFSK